MGLKKWIKKATGAIVGAVAAPLVGASAVVGAIAGVLISNHSSSSSNSNTGSVSTVVNDTNVYIPSMEITFEGNLFKPNTRLYLFFDGKDISSYVTPEGSSMGAPLTTDSTGKVQGKFQIPNTSTLRFIQGKKEVKFTDSPKNSTDETTYSTAYFTYSGDQDKTEFQDAGGVQGSGTSADPLVQTFMVLDTGGIYLNSLNLYFLAKDQKYPILFQIREVQEDTVLNTYLANSNYVLQPNQVNVSATGAVATSINLPAPVFLQEGKEYAIYLWTNAPATYTLATCVYGETNSYNQLSTKDPRIGSLMKYLGSNAWLRDSSRGIKFNLNKCAFDTTTGYTLALDNAKLGTKVLPNNSISTTNGTRNITVKDENHSFNIGDYVRISGLPANTNYGGINSDYINGTHKVTAVTYNTYVFDNVIIDGTETPIPSTANASLQFGTNVLGDICYQYDTLMLNNNEVMLTNTKLTYMFKGLSGQSLDGTETPNVFDSEFTEITNKNDYNTAKVKKINSGYNETTMNPSSDSSLQVDITFKTNNENITPVIDVANTNAILVENVINNQSTDELTESGAGIARYVTKDVSLSSQSNGLQVRFSGNLQGNSSVKVYYKILPISSTDTLDSQSWVEMTIDKPVSNSNNATTFSNYVYTVYDLPLFKAFKTKVLMLSSDSTKPPFIREYRAIAFQSTDNE